VICFLEPPTQASADSIPVVNVSRELGLSLSGLFQSYHEQSPFLRLRTLDSEQGWVPGFGAKATAIVDTPPISNVYVAIRYNYNSGTVTYSAPYPFGITRYLRSGEKINNVNVEIGKGILLFSDKAILSPLGRVDKPDPDAYAAEQDEAEKAGGCVIVSRGDTALVLQLAEEAFDPCP
jgi:hypothetical protein